MPTPSAVASVPARERRRHRRGQCREEGV